MEELLEEGSVPPRGDTDRAARFAGVLRSGEIPGQHRAAAARPAARGDAADLAPEGAGIIELGVRPDLVAVVHHRGLERSWKHVVARRGLLRSAARCTLVLSMLLQVVSCTNYEFRTGAGGTVEIGDLIRDLETRDPGEPRYLQQTTWVPLIFYRIRRFQRTEKTMEPNMPFGGYTYAERTSAGPLGLFWLRENVVHHDVDGEEFHREGRGGVGQRLVAWYDHRVATEEGPFAYHRVEALFGLLKTEQQGYPGRIDRFSPPKPLADGDVPLSGYAPSPAAPPPRLRPRGR